MYYIATEIKRRDLSQRQAADLLGVPQPHISLLLQAKLSNFSLERLLQMIAKLGVNLSISGQLTTTNEQGHITLNLPQFA
jgi:predicted XRE-type DNA-binding protein